MTAKYAVGQTPILGLCIPWKWVQPKNTEEIKQRLLEARDFNVHERERENMCSVAHGEIVRLENEKTRQERFKWAANERAEQAEARLRGVEKVIVAARALSAWLLARSGQPIESFALRQALKEYDAALAARGEREKP